MIDINVGKNIVKQLTDKFDPLGAYHEVNKDGGEMFELHVSATTDKEAWEILFMDKTPVITGSEKGFTYDGCDQTTYIDLTAENMQKIFILATASVIKEFDTIIKLLGASNTSDKNKNEWIKNLQENILSFDEYKE